LQFKARHPVCVYLKVENIFLLLFVYWIYHQCISLLITCAIAQIKIYSLEKGWAFVSLVLNCILVPESEWVSQSVTHSLLSVCVKNAVTYVFVCNSALNDVHYCVLDSRWTQNHAEANNKQRSSFLLKVASRGMFTGLLCSFTTWNRSVFHTALPFCNGWQSNKISQSFLKIVFLSH